MGSPGTQVRYEIPSNPAWMNLAGGMLQGIGGQANIAAQKEALQKEQDNKTMLAMITAMAQQNRLPTGPAPAGQPWAMPFSDAPTDWSKAENMVDYNTKVRDFENPDFAVQQGAAKQALSIAAQSGDPEAIFKTIQGLETMKSGVSPEKPATKGLMGWGAKPASRQRLKNGQIVTEYQQSDGSWSTELSKAKGKVKATKYQVGQIIATSQGNYKVTGGDLNNNPDIVPANETK